jgi:hypothetical protein
VPKKKKWKNMEKQQPSMKVCPTYGVERSSGVRRGENFCRSLEEGTNWSHPAVSELLGTNLVNINLQT